MRSNWRMVAAFVSHHHPWPRVVYGAYLTMAGDESPSSQLPLSVRPVYPPP
ncbi:unnamed protein product [Lettuce chlorosis virus]|uniref:p5 n=1 Tax=Lettuce chlorosis virus TaxID=642478 RepID=C6FJ57_9CLOS|nr:unnamed protein product [Lettuce chlorosis virus]ACQ82508.1 p5.6 [Lettuce chlorosis virus]ASS35986.1 p5.6 [Lettuce chlorosis virus]QEM20978.1 ORF1 p5.6 [Lettuce chlorosis virus]QHB15116.1 p5 [Lettuce chlorosis virus]QHB15128.1 p5 [Lettuce chlorosis virus]